MKRHTKVPLGMAAVIAVAAALTVLFLSGDSEELVQIVPAGRTTGTTTNIVLLRFSVTNRSSLVMQYEVGPVQVHTVEGRPDTNRLIVQALTLPPKSEQLLAFEPTWPIMLAYHRSVPRYEAYARKLGSSLGLCQASLQPKVRVVELNW